MSVAEPSHFPPPPECMQPDDPSAAESARSRLSKKRSFLNISLPTFTRNKSKRDVHKESEEPHTPLREHYDPQSITEPGLWSPRIAPPDLDDDVLERQLVRLEDGFAYANVELDEDYDKDVYRWAVLYENQRG